MLHQLTKQHYDNKLLPESIQNDTLFYLLGAVNSQQQFLNNCSEIRNDSTEIPSKRLSVPGFRTLRLLLLQETATALLQQRSLLSHQAIAGLWMSGTGTGHQS